PTPRSCGATASNRSAGGRWRKRSPRPSG
ncbi:MAG: hypothetical protein AVDCRST_MAG01-01-4012, partial [uncultured Rubrobacteraceae bacterium]